MKISEALDSSYKLLNTKSKTYKLDSEVLLADVLKKKNRLDLYLNLNQSLNKKEKSLFFKYIDERKSTKPVSKILNKSHFWSFELDISKKVLIPRPETEVLVDLVTKRIEKKSRIKFLDVGCGSGCISFALLDFYKNSSGIAIDISKEAVLNAKINFEKKFSTKRLKIIRQDLFTFKTQTFFDLIISNPPYLKLSEYSQLDKSIKQYEPKDALVADNKSGLKFFENIILKLKNNLKLNGYLALEIGDFQFKKIGKMLELNGFKIEDTFVLINNQVRCLVAKKVKN